MEITFNLKSTLRTKMIEIFQIKSRKKTEQIHHPKWANAVCIKASMEFHFIYVYNKKERIHAH